MEPLVLICEGCGARLRTRHPSKARLRDCPRCLTSMASVVDRYLEPEVSIEKDAGRSPMRLATGMAAVLATILSVASLAFRDSSIGASTPTSDSQSFSGPSTPEVVPILAALAEPEELTIDEDQTIQRPKTVEPRRFADQVPPAPRPIDQPPPTPKSAEEPAATPIVPSAPAPTIEPRRLLVRDRKGRAVAAREHGTIQGRMAVVLPDGQIGWPDSQVFTPLPFVPSTMDELRQSILDDPEFATFRVIQSAHYLVFYQGTKAFAQASSDLLEKLHDGLTGALKKQGLPVTDVEFPLVAIIDATEDDFRTRRKVSTDVQAYYEILSNRIYFYEKSRRDQDSPEVSALRKPQTVAHEGTHQILHNIGIQPRLSDWPLWLVEGFAEWCSPPKATRKGADWAGLGQINPIHMATIRDLDDPASTQIKGPRSVTIGRERGTPLVEYLVTRKDLTPTDYALSWALVHYLAKERTDDFAAFMKRMSELKPFEERTAADQLASFREVFGDDLAKMDGRVARYLSKIRMTDALPYFAVVFEQPVGPVVRRMAMVSQSPSVIRQWIESASAPEGGPSHWQAVPHRSRASAVQTAEQFMIHGR